MDTHEEVPLMLVYMFGEGAGAARAGASERLLRWCQAFDDWLAERERTCHISTLETSKTVWKRLLSHCKKAPWEVRGEDIYAYMEWMRAQGYAAATIARDISMLSNFYRWCAKKGIDAGCVGQGFNPTAGVKRPQVVPYGRAQVLSGEEARALLAVFLEEGSLLSLRDYAFFLARLRMGGKLAGIQQMQYGQMGAAELPADVRQAILDYLRAAGRLEGIQPEDYIFAPLRDPLRVEASGEAEEWNEGRHLSTRHLNRILTKFGKLAGIPEEKLKFTALRSTATLLRVEAGDSLEEIQAFLGLRQREAALSYLYWLGKVGAKDSNSGGRRRADGRRPGRKKARSKETKKLSKGAGWRSGGKERTAEKEARPLPGREPHRWKPWRGMTHGIRAKSQPPGEVAAMLAEGVQGLEWEIQGMRALARMLLEMQGRAKNSQEFIRLSNAHTLTAARLGEMVKAEKLLEKKTSGSDAWVEQTLSALDNVAAAQGWPPPSEEARRMAQGEGPEMALASRRLAEEIASVRIVLRRTFALALEAGEADELVRLAEVYGAGCARLVRLLQAESEGGGRLREILEEALEQAIVDVVEELGLADKLSGGACEQRWLEEENC